MAELYSCSGIQRYGHLSQKAESQISLGSNMMHRDRRVFVTCYAASGAAALVYQVVWTRLFSLQLGHTTAASSTVLAAFMGGMAVGAWIGGSVRVDSSRRLLLSYAVIELFIAAIAVVLPGALHAVVPAREGLTKARRDCGAGAVSFLRELDGHHHGAVGGVVPRRESHPFFAGGVEGNLEMLAAERRQIGGRDDLTVVF